MFDNTQRPLESMRPPGAQHNPDEHNRNFGFLISAWDRLFTSYRVTAQLPQERMIIGLPGIGERRAQNLAAMLALPVKYKPLPKPTTNH